MESFSHQPDLFEEASVGQAPEIKGGEGEPVWLYDNNVKPTVEEYLKAFPKTFGKSDVIDVAFINGKWVPYYRQDHHDR